MRESFKILLTTPISVITFYLLTLIADLFNLPTYPSMFSFIYLVIFILISIYIASIFTPKKLRKYSVFINLTGFILYIFYVILFARNSFHLIYFYGIIAFIVVETIQVIFYKKLYNFHFTKYFTIILTSLLFLLVLNIVSYIIVGRTSAFEIQADYIQDTLKEHLRNNDTLMVSLRSNDIVTPCEDLTVYNPNLIKRNDFIRSNNIKVVDLLKSIDNYSRRQHI